jgi:hypothetical protein
MFPVCGKPDPNILRVKLLSVKSSHVHILGLHRFKLCVDSNSENIDPDTPVLLTKNEVGIVQ